MKQREDTGFAGRLKQLREARGLTQQQLADAAGMNKFGLAKLEQGVTEPYWPTVLRLAAALGVSVAAFADGASAGPPTPSRSPAKKAAVGRGRAKK
jgi:transcriptional regulator with XRE-family HTH domain